MKKTRLYLDTSVPSFLFADDAPEKKEVTIRFWRLLASGIFEVVVSDLLYVEISRSSPSLALKLEERMSEIEPEALTLTPEIQSLAQRYMEEDIVPMKYRNDALHLACASVASADAVVSWNFRHMVKLSTIRGVNGVNRMLGYKEIEILTPQSWIQEGTL